MKQTKEYDYVHLKLEDRKENLKIEYRNLVRKDDKLFLGWIIGFLNQYCGDFRKFWEIFYKIAEMEYLQLFPYCCNSIFLHFRSLTIT